MSDLTLANSGYQTGAIDTASTLVNNVSATDAQHINGPNSAALQIEAILGVGTDLKGTAADLVARLAVEHNSDGTQKTLTVGKGGTGQTSFTAGGIPLGNGTSGLFLSAGIAEQVPFFQGSATASWTSGLQYQGPAQCGPSSAVSHGGNTTISVNQNLNGVNVYDNLTINAGVTVTVTDRAVIILATNTITINGTLTGAGGGGAGGAGGGGTGTAGSNGTEQAGGAGGGQGGDSGADGGDVLLHGITIQAGPTGGTGTGTAATAISGSVALRTMSSFDLLGGAGGGGGAGDGAGNNGGNGGAGGASIILMAPTIVLGASSTLSVAGNNGQSVSGGGNRGGGGGGGAGHIYIFCRTITNNGATFTVTGGSGGGGNGGGGGAGGAGAAGVRQIFQYGV